MCRANETPLPAAEWLAARLSTADLGALAVQGFVGEERLPSGRTCHKLRYRDALGRQRVVYLGVDAEWAGEIEKELARRQAPRQRRRHFARLRRDGGRRLRDSVREVGPLLVGTPWHFHGRALRRWRRPPNNFPRAFDGDTTPIITTHD